MTLLANAQKVKEAQEALALMEVRATTAEASLAELKTEVDARGAMLTALQSECDAAKAALASESAKVVDLTAKLAAKSAEVEQVKSSGALAVASAAAATVASLGHQAIPVKIERQSNSMSRAEFNNISPKLQMSFIKSGGKITD